MRQKAASLPPGAVVQWLRDGLHLIDESADTQYYAEKVSDTGGVYLVPAFTGLGAPHWDMFARGMMIGLTRGTSRAHIIRAALEAIAYQSKELMDALTADTGIDPASLKVDGGASANDFLMQFQADILDKPVCRPGLPGKYCAGRRLSCRACLRLLGEQG